MRLLLDTNIVIMLIEGGRRLSPDYRAIVLDPNTELSMSTASLWEIAIKKRSGKLELGFALDLLKSKLGEIGISVLPLELAHSIADPDLPRSIKDPWDRMITAVAEIEDMTLLTTDGALRDHPLAWRP